jgi:hypothetical protein
VDVLDRKRTRIESGLNFKGTVARDCVPLFFSVILIPKGVNLSIRTYIDKYIYWYVLYSEVGSDTRKSIDKSDNTNCREKDQIKR